MSSLQKGSWYFITISLDTHYVPSDAMIKRLDRVFPDTCYGAVEQESAENKKQHFHIFGVTQVRSDNMRTRIEKQLRDENYNVIPKKSVDIRIEGDPIYRLGYLIKDASRIVIFNRGFVESDFISGTEEYIKKSKHKKKTEMMDSKYMSILQIVRYLEDENVREPYELKNHLTKLRNDGKINYLIYQKLRPQQLIRYLREEYELDPTR